MKKLLVIIFILMLLVPTSAFAVDPRINIKGITAAQSVCPFQITHANGTILWCLDKNGQVTSGIIPKSKISTSGTFVEGDIPTLSKSKISTSGTWTTDEIPTLAQSKITDLTTDLASKYSASNRQTSIVNSEISGTANIAKSKISVTGAWDASEIPSGLDATKIADGSVTSTEFQFIGTISSNVQDQLNNKQTLDSDLTTIGGLTPSDDDVIQRKSGAWTNRSPSQLKTDLSLTKSDVGLSNVDNTSDANKPVSTATQTALDLKQSKSEKGQAHGYPTLNSAGKLNSEMMNITASNTAQIVSAGGTSLFKQRDNATQNTIKGLTTNQGITLTGNTNDVQIDTNFKIDTLSTIATDRFISAFDNATGDWSTKIFSINSITSTCSGTDKVSAFSSDNSTGFVTVTCSTDQTGAGGGYTKINNLDGGGQATVLATNTTLSNTQATFKTITQGTGITVTNGSKTVTIANAGVTSATGTSRNVTVSASTGAVTWNLGDLVVIVNGAAQTITKALTLNSLTLGGSMNANSQDITSIGSLQTGSDPADAGRIRLSNSENIASEASPAGTDGTIGFNANEEWEIIPNTSEVYSFNSTHLDVGTNKLAGSMTCTNGQILEYNSATGAWDCGTDDGGGYTKVNNLDGGGQATVLATNTTLSNTQATFKTITQGTGITITNGSKTVTVTNAGVTSMTGTANNVTMSASTGAVTANLGSNVVITGGSDQVISKNLGFGSDPADTGRLRMSNADLIASEASPAGTDGTIGFNANEEWEIIPNTNEVYSFNSTHFDVGTNKLAGSMTCTNGQILEYNSVTGAWDCGTDDGGGSSPAWLRSSARKTTDYTVTTSDGTIIVDTLSGNRTITLPTAASTSGYAFQIMKNDTKPSRNWLMIDAAGTETIDGALNFNITVNQGRIEIQSNGTKWSILNKDNTGHEEIDVPTKGSGYNRWWLPQHVSNTALTTLAAQTAAIQAYPFHLHQTTTFDQIGIDVSTLAAGSTCRVGIYTSDHRGYPFKLVSGSDVGTLSGAAAARVQNTFTTPITLQAGLYYTAAQCSTAATLALRANPIAAQEDILGFGSGANPAVTAGFTCTRAYAAFPTNYCATPTYLGAVSQHAVFLRASG